MQGSKGDKMIQKTGKFINWKVALLLGVFCNLILMTDSMATAYVSIESINNQYQLIRNGEPYYIKGAGGKLHFDRLAEYGGNSVRTWGSKNAQAVLDEAEKLGLTVTVGFWLRHENYGFDYNDEESVAQQLEQFRQDVLKFKNHPALLMWAIGNEYNIEYSNIKVWDAVEDIAKMISEEDGDHPVMTVLARAPKKDVQYVLKKCPHIDILGINIYGGLNYIPRQLKNAGWTKPFIITEWGPNGYWEVSRTKWGSAFEQNSTEKAKTYLEHYKTMDTWREEGNFLGSYVFVWGHKQETTPTWFGLFLEDGRETAAVDTMRFLWNGAWPEKRAPKIEGLTILNQSEDKKNIRLSSNMDYQFKVSLQLPDGDNLRLKWEILDRDSKAVAGNGLNTEEDLITMQESDEIVQFYAPEKQGPFRLFIYAYNEHNHAATMNIPFYVD